MAHDVFISYSNQDKTVADAVCATLESRKIRCWIAPRDVLPGSSYAEALIDGLNRSRLMVLVFSTSSNNSPQVMRELERAVNKGLTIIPLRIEDVMPSKAIEYFISSSHWLDALTPPLERHLQKLADTVQTLLASEAQKLPKKEPEPTTPKPTPTIKGRNKVRGVHVAIGIGAAVMVLIIAGVIFFIGGFGKRFFAPSGAPPPSPSGGLLFEDNFTDPTSGWPKYSGDTQEGDYVNGEYSLQVKKSIPLTWTNNLSAGTFKDLRLEIDARLFSGPNQSSYGVIFRQQDTNNYYFFLVSGQGDYTLAKRVRGVLTVLQNKTVPAFINQGNITNHLKVVCKGSQIGVDCNGHQLATVTDTSFAEGRLGLILEALNPPACAHFDNLKVYRD